MFLAVLAASLAPGQPPVMPSLNSPSVVVAPSERGPDGSFSAIPPPPVFPPAVPKSGEKHDTHTTPHAVPTLTDCLRGCPPLDETAPFLRVPRVEPVGECRDISAFDCKPTDTWKYTFHKAARFSIPRFDLCGEKVEADGLLIYEGMKLTVDRATGIYDLSFTATAPPTPVTLRLQLEFTKPGVTDEPVRLTLPPIRLEPDPTLLKGFQPLGTTVRVSHRGYSELFTSTKAQTEAKANYRDVGKHSQSDRTDHFQIDERWGVKRIGSARFGSALPNSDDPSR